MNIHSLGYKYIQNNIDKSFKDFQIARVISVHKDSFTISDGLNEIHAKPTGKLLFNSDSSTDFPTVGDWVYTQVFDDNSFAVIHDIVNRNSLLKRKTAGKKIDFQSIAANVDTAFIIQSLDDNFNINRLERYITSIRDSNIEPVILLSKTDLIDKSILEEKLNKAVSVFPKTRLVPFSNLNKESLSEINSIFQKEKTYCIIGSSGVGKTSLLNNLMDNSHFKTREVRTKDSKGKHTTTSRNLTVLENGAIIIDTPGMREFGSFDIESGLRSTFSEIYELAEKCKFKDCSHSNEIDCAIKEALEDGTLPTERYENFIKMKKESDYYSMNYYEKREKERQFAKIVKSVKVNDKRRMK